MGPCFLLQVWGWIQALPPEPLPTPRPESPTEPPEPGTPFGWACLLVKSWLLRRPPSALQACTGPSPSGAKASDLLPTADLLQGPAWGAEDGRLGVSRAQRRREGGCPLPTPPAAPERRQPPALLAAAVGGALCSPRGAAVVFTGPADQREGAMRKVQRTEWTLAELTSAPHRPLVCWAPRRPCRSQEPGVVRGAAAGLDG